MGSVSKLMLIPAESISFFPSRHGNSLQLWLEDFTLTAPSNNVEQATVLDATLLSNPQPIPPIADVEPTHQPLQGQTTEPFPRASGITAVYIHLYRQWLDNAEPDHHLMLINRRARGRHDTCVRLAVHCKSVNIKIEHEFIYRDEATLERAKTLARAERAQLPDELFCLIRRTEPEVPGIYHYPAKQCYKADITTGDKRQFKVFSYRYSSQHEAYDQAVKALYDRWAIDYPEQLFVGPGMSRGVVLE